MDRLNHRVPNLSFSHHPVGYYALLAVGWIMFSGAIFAELPRPNDLLGPSFRFSLEEVRQLDQEAESYCDDGKIALALQLYEEALKITRERLGVEHRDVAHLFVSLATIYRQHADFNKASSLIKRAKEIIGRDLGANYAILAVALLEEGLISFEQEEFREAISAFKSTISILETMYGKDSPLVAFPLNHLGMVYRDQGKLDEALPLLEQSSSIIERAFGVGSPEFAQTLNNLALAHLDLSDLIKAKSLCIRSLAIREKKFGTQNPAVAESLFNLALIQRDEGKYSDALASAEKSLNILETVFGPEDIRVAIILNGLAYMHLGEGDVSQAMELNLRSFKMETKLLGEEHVRVATTLAVAGMILRRLGNFTDSLKQFQRSLAIIIKTLGTQHTGVAAICREIGEVYLDGENYAEARQWFEKSLAIYEGLFGRDDAHIASALNLLAIVSWKSGDLDFAEKLLLRSLEIGKITGGETHPNVAICLQNLAALYAKQGDISMALRLYEQSISTAEKALGYDHPDVTGYMLQMASVQVDAGKIDKAIETFSNLLLRMRRHIVSQVAAKAGTLSLNNNQPGFRILEIFIDLCASEPWSSRIVGAEGLALSKALFEEIQMAQAAMDTDPHTTTRELRDNYQSVQFQLGRLAASKLEPVQRDARRRELRGELSQLETRLAERVGLVAQTIRERNVTLVDIARTLPIGSAVADFIQYRGFDFTVKTNPVLKAIRYAAYVTFPLEKDSTNLVVARVDLGEAAQINEVVEQIAKLMAAGQIAPKRLQPVLQRLSELVYAPLAMHLTNVSHLIVSPDGQLSRVPFEMLLHEGKYLVETKTISYVTSGREIVRLAAGQASPKSKESKVQSSKSLVMGDPDFDLDLPRRSRREEALSGKSEVPPSKGSGVAGRNPDSEAEVSLLTSAPTKYLSRSARGLKFTRLPSAAAEARSVASLLGKDTELRLGGDAREAELKAVVSPRVLHLATHGFFLSDQEFKYTNNLRDGLLRDGFALAGGNQFTARRSLAPPGNDWENPLVRCGIALAGANHSLQITNALAEDGLLTGLEASLLTLQGTELVVLSACDSGTGEIKIGEGVMSLRRAFRIAGAETVLASHWKVSDKATSQLMTEFMRRWRGGEPRVKAWREAQLALLRSQVFSNPYFWAAFTLTGQWR